MSKKSKRKVVIQRKQADFIRSKKRMVVIVRKAKPQKAPIDELVGAKATVQGVRIYSKAANNFYEKIRASKGVSSLHRYLTDIYEEVTGEVAPSNVPLVLIKRRVAYELLAAPYTEAGVTLPTVLRIQLTKSRKLSYRAWDNNEIEMAQLAGRALGIEETFEMVKAAAKEKAPKAHAGKSSGQTVQEWYQSVMEAQPEKKLTDEELAAACNKEFPKANERAPEYFSHVRNVFNLGKIPAQAGKAPKVPVPEFQKLKGKRTAMLFRGRGCVEKNAAVAENYKTVEKAPELKKANEAAEETKPSAKKKVVKKKVVKKVKKK